MVRRRFYYRKEKNIRQAGVTLWRQIEQILAEEIERRLIQPGARLPTEAMLAERFGVNRHTVRRAMAALEDRGLIRIEQGRGSFAQEPVLEYALGRRTRFSENLLGQQRAPGRRVVRTAELPANGPVAHSLQLRAGAFTYLLELIGVADDQPISFTSHYFPKSRFPGLLETYAEAGSISAALRRYGITDYQRQTTRVTAQLPELDVARHLHQPRHRPILQTESINVDAEGRPIEFGVGRFASDRVQFVIDAAGTADGRRRKASA